MSPFLTANNGLLMAKSLPRVAVGIELTVEFCRQRALCRELKLVLTTMVCREYL
jgi:hypothetical protein